MQAIWKGTISFGLVAIPIKVFSATEEKGISFRQVHTADQGRIRYRRVCEVCGKEIPYSDIGRGYELADGRVVVLSTEDFADLPLPTAKSVEVLEFVPEEQVDPLFFAKPYYLAADGAGAKPYVLLRDALVKTGQCALVKVAIRTREALALLREHEGVLVMQTMLWPDEVRDSSFAVPTGVDVKKQEVAMAESYIATLTADFDPDRYKSDYREALEALVAAKVEGLELPETDEGEGQVAEVVDLVAALRASVAAAKARRGEQPSSAGTKPAKRAASKTMSRKAASSGDKTAKKTASKAAKKQAAKASSKSTSKTTTKAAAKRKSA
jgi:DNA end-binding protein Ku